MKRTGDAAIDAIIGKYEDVETAIGLLDALGRKYEFDIMEIADQKDIDLSEVFR